MFIPIGHDQSTVRRLPWVTFSIMGLCLLMFVVTLGGVESAEEEAQRRFSELAEYAFANPDLELEPEIEEHLYGFFPEYQGQRDAFKEILKEGVTARGMFLGEDEEEEESVEDRQKQLDQLTSRFYSALGTSPYFELGLVPAHQKAYAYITHQFMHGGFGHLFFNMLFLYLAGPYIEDKWGRPLFLGFYLSAGVVAALIYVLKYPSMTGPLVGASGAIAGLMGAFLIRHSKTKIRFLFFFFIAPRVFDAPAWIMLPLWLLREFFYGQAIDSAGGQGTGVAHWAHVAGFVFGLVFALAVRRLRIEEQFIDKALDAREVVHESPVLEEAIAARQRGDLPQAEKLLSDHLEENAHDFDAAAAYWDVARDLENIQPAIPHMLRVIRDGLRNGEFDLVAQRWPEVLEVAPSGMLDPALTARVAESLTGLVGKDVLAATVEAGLAASQESTPSGVLMRLARVAATIGSPAAKELVERALTADDLPQETRGELTSLQEELGALDSQHAEQLGVGGDGAAASTGTVAGNAGEPWALPGPDPVAVAVPVVHKLKVMEAVPVKWADGKLSIMVGGERRSMSLRKVGAVAVGGITVPGEPAFVVVDLMLDPPWSDRPKLRVVRLLSNGFDPRTLIPEDNAESAFKAFLEDLISESGAVGLPDPDGARGRPFRRFSGLSEYEAEVLGVGE